MWERRWGGGRRVKCRNIPSWKNSFKLQSKLLLIRIVSYTQPNFSCERTYANTCPTNDNDDNLLTLDRTRDINVSVPDHGWRREVAASSQWETWGGQTGWQRDSNIAQLFVCTASRLVPVSMMCTAWSVAKRDTQTLISANLKSWEHLWYCNTGTYCTNMHRGRHAHEISSWPNGQHM